MEPETLNPLGELCQCVSEHSPASFVPTYHHIIPESWGGQKTDDNMVWLCPNAHTAVHRLVDEYVRNNGLPPWETRQHFSPYIRELAQRAWDNRPDNPTITSLPEKMVRP